MCGVFGCSWTTAASNQRSNGFLVSSLRREASRESDQLYVCFLHSSRHVSALKYPWKRWRLCWQCVRRLAEACSSCSRTDIRAICPRWFLLAHRSRKCNYSSASAADICLLFLPL